MRKALLCLSTLTFTLASPGLAAALEVEAPIARAPSAGAAASGEASVAEAEAPGAAREPAGTLLLGAGYDSDEGLGFLAEVSTDDLFRSGSSLRLRSRLHPHWSRSQLSFSPPQLGDWRLTAEGVFDRSQREDPLGAPLSIEELRGAFRVRATRALTEQLRLEVGGGFVQTALAAEGELAPSLPAELLVDGPRGLVELGLRLKTGGLSVHAGLELAGGRGLSFLRSTLEARYRRPLPGGLVLNLDAGLGRILGGAPYGDRYFLGGLGDLPGHAYRSIGPRRLLEQGGETFSVTVGGVRLAQVGLELEVPLVDEVGLRGFVFYRAGNTWGEEEAWFSARGPGEPLGLRQSAGLGLHWDSPIGPLRFTWAAALLPGEQAPAMTFGFSMGF